MIRAMQIHRRWFLLLLFGWAIGAAAQDSKPSTNYVLKVTPDRADALYKVGEPVTFHLELTLDKQPVPDAEAATSVNCLRSENSRRSSLLVDCGRSPTTDQ